MPDGKYQLTRPLLVVFDANDVKKKPQVTAFVSYYLSNVKSVIDDVGYLPEADQAMDETKTRWLKLIN
jgi:ABC-type phosphate transport system substrate-binding protein